MNRDECAMAVAAVAVADYRVRNLSELDSNALVAMWSRHLPDVPLDWTLGLVTRHYATADPAELTSGRVLMAWRSVQRVEQAREHAPALLGDWFTGKAPEGFAEFVAATTGAWQEARRQSGPGWTRARDDLRERIDSEPLPWTRGVRVDDSRERRCRHHDICICTHTECRDGWLDVGASITDQRGRPHPAVKRCPVCAEAVEMRSELKPKRGSGR